MFVYFDDVFNNAQKIYKSCRLVSIISKRWLIKHK